MNGWQRIGIALSVLLGVPSFLFAYLENDSAFGYIYPSEQALSLEGQPLWDAIWREARAQQPDRFQGCITSTVKVRSPFPDQSGDYAVSCDNHFLHAGMAALPFAAIPIALIWGFGWTIAWIRAGFRRGEK